MFKYSGYLITGIATFFAIISGGSAVAETSVIVWDEPAAQVNSVASPIIDDEMMISDSPVTLSQAVTPEVTPEVIPDISAEISKIAETPVVPETTDQKMAIIWDEPLPEAAPIAAAEAKKTTTDKAATKAPVKSQGKADAKTAKKDEKLPKKAEAAPVVAPVAEKEVQPARTEIASISDKAPANLERASANDDLLTSLLGKIRILETEKENLRKKLMQVDPGKLKDVYQCTVETNEISKLQAQVDVLVKENKQLKNINKDAISIPKLPAAALQEN